MRYLILFSLISALLVMIAQPAYASTEKIVESAARYCLAAANSLKGTAALASEMALPEFSPDQAIKFSPDGGRVFALPGLEGIAVLIAPKPFPNACSIAVREVDAPSFCRMLDQRFSKEGFILLREKRKAGEEITRREYSKTAAQTFSLLATASDALRPGGMQALITLSPGR
jgi:hypothetical protein